jgi:Ca-activated chloride channel family protein
MALTFLAMTASIVALARPQRRHRYTEGISIMLVCDVSESMRALDFRPNRLEKAKEVMRDFVADRRDDQIGIVIFGQDTFVLCPLTTDYDSLQTFIDRIDFDLVNGRGTAIGMGLANAVNKLRLAGQGADDAKSKVAILLTDGENNRGQISPLTAADIAKEFHVRVYTIGIGSRGMIDVPVASESGMSFRTQRYPSNINIEELKEIAEMTGAQFFAATSEKMLQEIFGEIDKLEKSRLETSATYYFDELAHLLVVPALALFGLAAALEQSWLRTFP